MSYLIKMKIFGLYEKSDNRCNQMYINGMLLFKYEMIIFENVKMTYDGINILRNEISKGLLSMAFKGVWTNSFFDSLQNILLLKRFIRMRFDEGM